MVSCLRDMPAPHMIDSLRSVDKKREGVPTLPEFLFKHSLHSPVVDLPVCVEQSDFCVSARYKMWRKRLSPLKWSNADTRFRRAQNQLLGVVPDQGSASAPHKGWVCFQPCVCIDRHNCSAASLFRYRRSFSRGGPAVIRRPRSMKTIGSRIHASWSRWNLQTQ